MTVDLRRSAGPGRTGRRGSIALAAEVLRNLGMRPAEIDEILESQDPRLVHRHLELHRERLEERLAEQRAMLAWTEALLTWR